MLLNIVIKKIWNKYIEYEIFAKNFPKLLINLVSILIFDKKIKIDEKDREQERKKINLAKKFEFKNSKFKKKKINILVKIIKIIKLIVILILSLYKNAIIPQHKASNL